MTMLKRCAFLVLIALIAFVGCQKEEPAPAAPADDGPSNIVEQTRDQLDQATSGAREAVKEAQDSQDAQEE